MSKEEFLRQLELNLMIGEAEKEEVMCYYSEYFEEAGPENEQAVLEELGDPAALAKKLTAECEGDMAVGAQCASQNAEGSVQGTGDSSTDKAQGNTGNASGSWNSIGDGTGQNGSAGSYSDLGAAIEEAVRSALKAASGVMEDARKLADDAMNNVFSGENVHVHFGGGDAEDEEDSELAHLMEELEDAEEELIDAESELENAQSALEDAQSEADDAQQDVDDAAEEVEAARKAVEAARAAVDVAAEDEISDAEDALSEAEDELADAEDALEDAQDALKDAIREKREAERELREAQREVRAARKEYETAKREAESAKREADAAAREAEREMKAAQREADAAAREAEHEMKAAQREADAAARETKREARTARKAVFTSLKDILGGSADSGQVHCFSNMDMDPFTDIHVDVRNCPIQVERSVDGRYGVDVRLAVRKDEDLTIENLNGLLTIQKKRQSKWSGGWMQFNGSHEKEYVKLYLPEAVYNRVELFSSNASVTVTDLETVSDLLNIDTSNDRVRLERVQVNDRLKIDTSNGAITLTQVFGRDIYADTSNASIVMERVFAEKATADTSNGGIKVKDCEITQLLNGDTSNASIEVTLPGAESDYSIHADTSNSKIYVNGKSMGDEYNTYGGVKAVRLDTSNGRITIGFVQ